MCANQRRSLNQTIVGVLQTWNIPCYVCDGDCIVALDIQAKVSTTKPSIDQNRMESRCMYDILVIFTRIGPNESKHGEEHPLKRNPSNYDLAYEASIDMRASNMNIVNRVLQSNTLRRLCYVIFALLVLRMIAPTIVENTVNRSLENAPGITGTIKDVDLHLYRGAYEIQGIELFTIKDGKQYPLVSVEKLDISIFWSKLIRGQLVTELIFFSPRFTFADIKDKDSDNNKYDAAGNEETWLGISRELVPLDIDRLEVIDGVVEFEGQSLELGQKGKFYVENVNMTVVGLTAEASDDHEAPGEFWGSAMIYGDSKADMKGSFDMFSEKPVFDLNVSIAEVPAKNLDKLIKIYAPFDIEAGSFIAATEMRADQGQLEGYVKVGARNLDVFSWKEDIKKDGDNPFEAFVDMLIGGVSEALTNPTSGMVATQIPVEGSLDQPELSAFQVFMGLLKNAFIKAVNVKVDNILSFSSTKTNSNEKD